MAARIEALWHSDTEGWSKPEELRGKRFLHVATSTLYVVTGFSLNVTSDRVAWMIHYQRENPDMRKEFSFSRELGEFKTAGKFVEVK